MDGYRGKVDEGEIRIAKTDAKWFTFFSFFFFLVCIWCALPSERRLLTMLGAKVRDDQQLAKYAQSLLGQTRPWDRIAAAESSSSPVPWSGPWRSDQLKRVWHLRSLWLQL